MKERAILVVLESVVDLLVPDHSTVGRRNVDKFNPKCVANKIVGEDSSTLKACVGPL